MAWREACASVARAGDGGSQGRCRQLREPCLELDARCSHAWRLCIKLQARHQKNLCITHAFTHVRDTSCAAVKAKQRELAAAAQKVQRSRLGQCSLRVHGSQCRAEHDTVQQRRQHASAVNVKRPSQPLQDERQRLLPSCTAPPSTTSAPPRVPFSKCLVVPLALRNVLPLPDCTTASQRRSVAAVVAAVVLRDQNPAQQQCSPAGLVKSASGKANPQLDSCHMQVSKLCVAVLSSEKKLRAKSACGHCIDHLLYSARIFKKPQERVLRCVIPLPLCHSRQSPSNSEAKGSRIDEVVGQKLISTHVEREQSPPNSHIVEHEVNGGSRGEQRVVDEVFFAEVATLLLPSFASLPRLPKF